MAVVVAINDDDDDDDSRACLRFLKFLPWPTLPPLLKDNATCVQVKQVDLLCCHLSACFAREVAVRLFMNIMIISPACMPLEPSKPPCSTSSFRSLAKLSYGIRATSKNP